MTKKPKPPHGRSVKIDEQNAAALRAAQDAYEVETGVVDEAMETLVERGYLDALDP